MGRGLPSFKFQLGCYSRNLTDGARLFVELFPYKYPSSSSRDILSLSVDLTRQAILGKTNKGPEISCATIVQRVNFGIV